MAFYRRRSNYRPKGRYSKRKKTYRRKTTSMNPKMLKAIVKRTIEGEAEVKMTQYEYSASINATGGILQLCNWPAQGTGSYGTEDDGANIQGQRIGNKIKIKSIDWRYYIDIGDATNIVRVILFQWLEDNENVIPGIGNILLEEAGAYPYISPLNNIEAAKYRVIHDRTYNMITNTSTQQIVKHVKLWKKNLVYREIQMTGNSQSGGIGQVIKGNLYYLIVSDSTVVPHPSITSSIRLNYIDI